jgi:hypothetical protein
MNILKPDSSGLQLQRNSTRTCIRSHCSTCIKPHPSRRWEREKQKRDEDKKPNRSDKRGKKESTHRPKSDWEKKFQNNHKALAGMPQAEIDEQKADKASCWHCQWNSHHTLQYFVKKTSKGTELATTVAAVSKKAKHQQPSEDSEDENDKPEPVSK